MFPNCWYNQAMTYTLDRLIHELHDVTLQYTLSNICKYSVCYSIYAHELIIDTFKVPHRNVSKEKNVPFSTGKYLLLH